MANDDDRVDDVAGQDGDEVNEITQTSWLQRIGKSLAGLVVGLALVVGAGVLLFWNEGRAVQTARSLTEGSGLVRQVRAEAIDTENEGKLVYVMAQLTADELAVDEELGVQSPGVRLKRTVEMFQWVEDSESETRKKLGGGEETHTTYKYRRSWSDQPQDSSRFRERPGHVNPQMTYRTRSALAPEVKAGAFIVPTEMLYGFGTEQPMRATDAHAETVRKRLGKPVQAVDGVLYVASDAARPQVGDYRITFTYVPLQMASIVAQQAGSTFDPYRTKAGGTVELIKAGQIDAAALFKQAQDDNRTMTWLLRGAGVVAMFVGFVLITRPISVLADVVPLLGSLVGAGLGVVALLCTLVVAPIVVAVAWFAYRPTTAFIVLAIGALSAVGALLLGRHRRAREPAPPAAA